MTFGCSGARSLFLSLAVSRCSDVALLFSIPQLPAFNPATHSFARFAPSAAFANDRYEPIRARVGLEEEVLTAPQLNTIFGNITVIYALHRDLLSDLEAQGTEPGDIGKVFALFSPYLKMYTAYLNNNSAGTFLGLGKKGLDLVGTFGYERMQKTGLAGELTTPARCVFLVLSM